MNLRRGKVARVLSPNYFDVQFDLDFGITCRVCVVLEDAKKIEKTNPEFDLAMHSLILILGGKDIFILPKSEDFPANRMAFEAKVYRKGEVDSCTVELNGEKYVDIKMYLDKVSPKYEIAKIKEDFRRIK